MENNWFNLLKNMHDHLYAHMFHDKQIYRFIEDMDITHYGYLDINIQTLQCDIWTLASIYICIHMHVCMYVYANMHS